MNTSEHTLITPRSLDECTYTPCWECVYKPPNLDSLRMDMGCEHRAAFLQAREGR